MTFTIESTFRRAKALLADGTSFALYTYGGCSSVVGTSPALQHTCGYIHVGINGKNSPNTFGKDVFSFWITPEGVFPTGTQVDNTLSLSQRCNLNSTIAWNGDGCAAWVIEKGNMDYLRKEISW